MATKRGHGEGTVFKRADGRWVAQISLDGGKRKSYTAKTRQEAQRKLAEARRDYAAGLPVVSDQQTVGGYLASWLETIVPTLRYSTWKGYRAHVTLHIAPTLGHAKLSKLTAQQVQALYAAKLAGGLTSTTVRRIHATLHKALEAALRLGLVSRNVSDLVDVPRAREREMRFLSREQARIFLDSASASGDAGDAGDRPADRLEALYYVAISTGMRQGELLALRWRDVDLEACTLRVRVTLQRDKSGALVFGEPKTKRSRRQIALSVPAIEALRRHRARQHRERHLLGAAWTDHDLVFCRVTGEPLEATGVYRAFLVLLASAGLPPIRFHDLRHTAATLLLGARVNPKIVSEMLGHSTVSITLDLYSHVIPDMQQDAAAVMGSLLLPAATV